MKIKIKFELENGHCESFETTVESKSGMVTGECVILNRNVDNPYVWMFGSARIYKMVGNVLCGEVVPINYLQVTYMYN